LELGLIADNAVNLLDGILVDAARDHGGTQIVGHRAALNALLATAIALSQLNASAAERGRC